MAPLLSFYMLTNNSEKYLNEILAAVQPIIDEFIILDSGSTDQTRTIAEAAGASWHFRELDSFARQRTHAIGLCTGRWVLTLDDDELPDDALIAELTRLRGSLLTTEIDAYRISRHWTFMGDAVRALYPVSSPDFPIRLHRRVGPSFNGANGVHEALQGADRIALIAVGGVIHRTFETRNEVSEKLDKYTDLAARDLLNQRKRVGAIAAVIHSMGALIKWYLIRRSWQDGALGVRATVFAVQYTWLKYVKAAALRRDFGHTAD